MSRQSHRPTCPACGAEPDRIVTIPQGIIACPGCGLRSSHHEWMTHSVVCGSHSGQDLVVRKEIAGGGTRWLIPAARNAKVSMVIRGIWCVLALALCVITGPVLFDQHGPLGCLLLLGMPVPLLVLGLVALGLAVIRHHAEYRISVAGGKMSIRRSVLGFVKEVDFPISRIRHICRMPGRRSADCRREAVEIAAGRRRFLLGGHLSPDERRRLVESMRELVSGAPVSLPGAAPGAVPMPEVFSFEVTHRMLHQVPFACAAMAAGSVFLFVVLRFSGFESVLSDAGDPWFFRLIEVMATLLGNVMTVVFFLLSLAMGLGGLWLLVHSLRLHRCRTSVEGARGSVAIRIFDRGGRMRRETFYQKMAGDSLRASLQTITGGVVLKRLELVRNGESTTLVSSVPAEDAVEVMKRLLAPGA